MTTLQIIMCHIHYMKSPTEYFNQQFHKYIPNQYISNDYKIFNIISAAILGSVPMVPNIFLTRNCVDKEPFNYCSLC